MPGDAATGLGRRRDAAVGIVAALAAALVRLLVLHLLGDAVSISELDQLLERRWPGKVRRGLALKLPSFFENPSRTGITAGFAGSVLECPNKCLMARTDEWTP